MSNLTGTVDLLEKQIPNLMKKNDVVGLSIVLIRDAEIAWSKGYGFKNLDLKTKTSNETVFEIASLTKPVVALLALKLSEQKDLDLNTPLVNYLPKPQLINQPLENQLTARQILTHSTGFPNWGKTRGSPNIFFTPGERFSYSGEGFMYLQKVLESLTGKDLESLAQEMLFHPLGLEHASFLWRKDIENLSALGYLRDKTPKNMKPFAPTAAGSLHLSPSDYAQILICLMNQGNKRDFELSNALIQEMLSPQVPVSDAGLSDRHHLPKSQITESTSVFWGLGWGLEKIDTKINHWHWGNNSSFQHIVFWNRTEKNGMVLMSNSERVPFIWENVLKIADPGPHPGLEWLFSHYF